MQQNAGPSGPSTTSMSPAGASRASSCRIACRAASLARTLESFRRKRSQAPPGRRRQKYPSRTRLRLCDARNIHARQRLRVFRKRAVGADHENVPQFVGIICAHFLDSRIIPARRFIAAHQQLNLGGNVRIHRRQGHRIQAASRFLLNPTTVVLAGALAISAAVRAACRIRCGERSSVYAYPVRSPETTRTRTLPKSPATPTSPVTHPPSARSR